MACLYLADLQCRALEGVCAMTFDQSGEVTSISSEKLRKGLSAILERLHRGDTLDEVIRDISGSAYADTMDFTRRFIKGNYNEEIQDYDGDPQSLAFCVGYINYMNRLDALDPDTHPAGSVLMDDFGTTRPTPLEADAAATSDFYRFVASNTLVASTVPNDHTIDHSDLPGSYSFAITFLCHPRLPHSGHFRYRVLPMCMANQKGTLSGTYLWPQWGHS